MDYFVIFFWNNFSPYPMISYWNANEKYLIPLHTILLFVNFNIPISLSLWATSCSISFHVSSSVLSLPLAMSNLLYPLPQSSEFLISILLFLLLWKCYFVLSKMWLDICIVSCSFIIFWYCPLFFNIFNVLILVLIILLSTIFVGLICSPLFFITLLHVACYLIYFVIVFIATSVS